MALLPSSVDYTDKDFDALRARLHRLVASAFPTWTDFNVANFGNILLEVNAHVGDVLGFYLDRHAEESRFATAKLRRSMLSLVKLIGYRPASATAATVTETFTLAAPAVADVVLPAGTTIRTERITDPVKFQLLDALTIQAGQTTASAVIEHSQTRVETTTTTGKADQEIALKQTPYIDASAIVSAAGGAYAEVDNFLSSTSLDRHFVVVVDQNDRATIRFGNGVAGTIPVGTIAVSYKTGGGPSGRVEAGTLTKLDGNFTDANGNPVQITVTNPTETTVPQARESVEQIRANAPASLRVLGRAVAREDYELAALKISGVARALHLTRNENPAIGENAGNLYIVPDGLGTPSQSLLDAVAAQFAITGPYPKTTTYQLSVVNPAYLVVDLDATVWFASGINTQAKREAVRDAIAAALGAYFALTTTDTETGEVVANDRVDFGFNMKDVDGQPANELPLSDIYNVVRDIVGVRKIGNGDSEFLLNGARADLAVAAREFPKLGTVTIRDGDTGQIV